MRKESYFCDRCGAEERDYELYALFVEMLVPRIAEALHLKSLPFDREEADLCRKCREELEFWLKPGVKKG